MSSDVRAVLNLCDSIVLEYINKCSVLYIHMLVVTDKMVVSSMLLYLQPNRTCIRTISGIEVGYIYGFLWY